MTKQFLNTDITIFTCLARSIEKDFLHKYQLLKQKDVKFPFQKLDTTLIKNYFWWSAKLTNKGMHNCMWFWSNNVYNFPKYKVQTVHNRINPCFCFKVSWVT